MQLRDELNADPYAVEEPEMVKYKAQFRPEIRNALTWLSNTVAAAEELAKEGSSREAMVHFRRFVPFHWMELPEAEWLNRAIGTFNSHFWRDNAPDSILLVCWRLDPLDECSRLETTFRRGMSPWANIMNAYDYSQVAQFRMYPAANFNDFDFGVPIPVTERYR